MMKRSRLPPTWRIALFICVVAAIFWLGAVNVRALIGSDLLKRGTLEFEEYLAPEAELEIFRLISATSVVVLVSYAITVISSIVFLATSPFRMKQHGWLLMSAILFYVFVPIEIFTLYIDWKMIYLEFFTTADNALFRELFLARVGALAGAPVIAHLCYYTIIALAIFQPMKKSVSPST